jgi:Ca2+-binding RTX toxin-like protein
MRQASIAGGTMPRLRPFRSAPSQDVHPLGWVVTIGSTDSGDAAGAVAVFETAEPVADGGHPIAEFDGFAGAFVFFEETVTTFAPAQILAADSDSSGAGMLDRAAIDTGAPSLTDEFGAATVDLRARIPDAGSASRSDDYFSFAGWSAGSAPSQLLDDLPLHYGAAFAMQVEPVASGIHALDCAAGGGGSEGNGFEAAAVDATAAPAACSCCAFTYGSGPSGPQTDDYNLSGTKWGSSGASGSWGGTVTWSFVDAGFTNQTGVGFFSGSTVSLSNVFSFDYVSVFTQAFEAWSSVANIDFVQVADGGGNFGVGNSAYIRIGTGHIDGNYNVLARAFYPATAGNPQNYAYSGDMVFDSGESSFWTASSLLAVATHEIGHAIGLGHSSISSALMAPYYNPSITAPTADDIAGARAIYGASSGAPVPSDDYADQFNDTTAPYGQVAVGGSSTGHLESAGDRDWFRVTLTAGVTYVFDLRGAPSNSGTLSNPYLYLYNSAGNLITFDDDGGSSYDSQITYSATASGTYYLGAATYNDAASGTYRLSVGMTDPILNGDGSDNIFIATAARETFRGFGGADTVSYADQPGSLGVTVSLLKPKSNTGFAAGDTYDSIENLIGTSRNDRLTGNAGDNILDGGGGADQLNGDAGFDTASYLNAMTGVTANLTNAKLNTGDAFGDTYKSIERLFGSQFEDVLTGGKGVEAVMGGGGDDIIDGGARIDTLTGGAGRDTFRFASIKEAGDIITDFTTGDDLIGIVRKGFKIDARVDLGAGGVFDFASEYFVSNTTGTANAVGHGQFVFNTATDQLLWDQDGAGRKAAVVVAQFTTDINLTAYHFDLS